MSVYVTGRNDDYDAYQYRNLPQSLVVTVSGFGGVLARLWSWPVHAVSAHLADFDQFMAVSGSVRLATRRRWSATAAQESATTNVLTRGPETSSAVVVRCPAIKL